MKVKELQVGPDTASWSAGGAQQLLRWQELGSADGHENKVHEIHERTYATIVLNCTGSHGYDVHHLPRPLPRIMSRLQGSEVIKTELKRSFDRRFNL